MKLSLKQRIMLRRIRNEKKKRSDTEKPNGR